ncbi:MAG: hypothetical protein IK081_05920 [Lachnospiraceae bacterium]|nr:hypothetical protein [Lachnospiraceae bacterium]
MEQKKEGHPYLTVTIACLLLFFFGFCEKSNLCLASYVYAGIMSILFLAFIAFHSKPFREHAKNCYFFALTSAYAVGTLILTRCFNDRVTILLWAFLLLLVAVAVALKKYGVLTTQRTVILLLTAGIAFRFVYVLYTSSNLRQHDVGVWLGIEGHARYIEYWYENGFVLPDFDVREVFQFYHPPFHHLLMALFLKILTSLGMEYLTACEALQFLPFLYSSLSLVVCLRIFQWVKLDGLPLLLTFAISCFHPTFIFLSGYYNNDTLTVLFMFLTILLALQWHREPSLKRILPIALTIGFGMMTKFSVWMIALAVAFLFLSKFMENGAPKLRLFGQYFLFGIICIPLGLWWPIRNFFAFGVPITYIPSLGKMAPQYCGDVSTLRRILDFGSGRLKYVYIAFQEYGAPFNDFNPALSLIKTSLFDEEVNVSYFPSLKFTGPCLLALWICLCILCTVSFFAIMIRKSRSMDEPTRSFFFLLATAMIVFYYVFCFSYPFVCTMNIRYCVPLIPLFAMGHGLCMQEFSGKSTLGKLWKSASLILTILFCLASCIVYTQIG